MKAFHGRLTSLHSGIETAVTVSLDDEWIRIWTGTKRLGAYRIASTACERLTAFRFSLDLDGVAHSFLPQHPNEFAEAIGAVVDLRPASRFGLGERVRAAKAEMAAAKARQDSEGSGSGEA